ncbi:MAG: hypothetical protein OHK0013_02280 [Sandaracinaceae bacterium]
MSGAHDSHAHDEQAEVHPHPPIPTVTDEAADTPMWVPVAGLALFLVLALYVAIRSAVAPTPTEPVVLEEVGAEVAAGDAPPTE